MSQRSERLQKYSNLGPLTGKTFDNLIREGQSPEEHYQALFARIFDTARSFAINPDGWLVLMGPSGTGKTHIAAAIANERIAQGQPALFMVTPDLLDHLRSAFAPDSEVTYDELFEQVRNAPLLVLDDLGANSSTPWAQEKLFQLINHRYNSRLPTVVTSNLRRDDLDERLRMRLCDEALSKLFSLHVDGTSADLVELNAIERPDIKDKTFEKFNINFPKIAPDIRKQVTEDVRYSKSYAQKPKGWLVIRGTAGSGRTHFAAAVAHERQVQSSDVLYIFAHELMDTVRQSMRFDDDRNSRAPASEGRDKRILQKIMRAPFLVVDDVGKFPATQWEESTLYQLVNYRQTSNLPTVFVIDESQKRLPDWLSAKLMSKQSYIVTLSDPKAR